MSTYLSLTLTVIPPRMEGVRLGRERTEKTFRLEAACTNQLIITIFHRLYGEDFSQE
jgi:hypothetical protein